MIIFDYADQLAQTNKELLDQLYRLRARSFLDRRGWSVVVNAGKEIDRFDKLNPLYVLSVSQQGQLLASLRLLPTTGPHMLSDVFPETMSRTPLIRHPLIWESSRFCVDTKAVTAHTDHGLNYTTGELLTGLFEIALGAGVLNIVSVYDLFLERILRRAGCRFDRLGSPYEYDGLPTVAGVFDVSADSIRSIRERSGIRGDVFEDSSDPPKIQRRA